MIRSQPFTDAVPLHCELYKCFPVFFSLLRCNWKAGVGWSWVGYFPSLAQLGSHITPASEAPMNWFPWRSALLRRREYSEYFRMVSFPAPCEKQEWIFLRYLLWEPGWTPGGIVTTLWGPLWLDWVLLEFLTLRIGHTVPPAFCQSPFGFFVPKLSSLRCFMLRALCSRKPAFACQSFPFWEQQFALCLLLFYGLEKKKKNCWFFSLFSFSLVRTEWWLSSSFHVKLETGSPLIHLCTIDFSIF